MPQNKFTAGQKIFSESDAADYAYLIEEGWVEIQAGENEGAKPLSLIGPGQIFGEMGLIDGSPRSASAVAQEDCRLLPIDIDTFNAMLGRTEPFQAELLTKLVMRFREAQKSLLDGTGTVRTETSEAGPGYAALARHRDISQALKQGEIEPYFQPCVDLVTGKWLGFEALARWRMPQSQEVVPPLQFLPLAERTGLIRQIDLAIADRALGFCQKVGGNSRPYIHVNFSAWHFRDDEDFVARFALLLESQYADPRTVRVELTETMMLDDPDSASRIMSGLADLGVKLALDDFGTGFSSLSVLHRMPIDIIKIDRSLVVGALSEPRRHTVLRHVIAMARDLGIEVVAEGIESRETADALVQLGCMAGQGSYFAWPMPAAKAAEGWLKS